MEGFIIIIVPADIIAAPATPTAPATPAPTPPAPVMAQPEQPSLMKQVQDFSTFVPT